ncbi:hypothetical protein B0T25DRAFT_541210 [Lasiosphaeria hispida]|uniref:Uncharacterized protein n=1 Tax=Lasiosphaeria hispida TaxID=260671 RepID=A0AAJ0HNR0_9PEZI|nr:hypothetical protein B0T25DRAFT_541210 [Lasiosphaeria hispida]
MGWFKSALQGIGSGVNWIKQNTGTITQAAEVIAKLAAATKADGFVDGGDPASSIFPNFAANATALEAAAQAKAEEHLAEVIASLPKHIANDSTLKTVSDGALGGSGSSAFLWTYPSVDDNIGHPSKQAVQDLGKMLAQRSFPTTLSTGSGTTLGPLGGWFDVARGIGGAIFGALGADVSDDVGTPSIQTKPFAIANHTGDCVISGAHAFYRIPLGEGAPNQTWHAAIAMHMTTTGTYRQAESERTKVFSFTQPVHTSGSNPQWLVTMNVRWEDAVSAQIFSPALLSQIQSQVNVNAGWVLHHTSLDGMDQQIKLECPVDFIPNQASMLVRGLIKTVLGGNPVLTPDITITNSSLVLP